MSLPHVCKCGICGRELDTLPDPAYPFGPGPGIQSTTMGFCCTKHGLINGPECDQCVAERRAQSET